MFKRHLTMALAALAMLLTTVAPAAADEGMWTFDNFPTAAVKTGYGVTIDKAWLDHVQASAVRLSTGCSASVVSGQGLVLTNHHCVSACAQNLSTAGRDYIKMGFTAPARTDERLCPGMQAEILLSISDVGARVAAATDGRSGADFTRARDATKSAIEKEACAGQEAKQRCQVVTLYQGGQFKLYIYRKFSDVRLVFAPEQSTAFFGGDPDNFNFPRYDLDCSFVRLYENGAPVATPTHLRWNASAPKAGDLVFVAGNPGSTQRLLTADQLLVQRNSVLPQTLLRTSELRGRLIAYGERGPEEQRTALHTLFGLENRFKVNYGQFQALSIPGFIEAKQAADMALKARVDADPKLKAQVGDPWAEIAAADRVYGSIVAPAMLLERQPAQGSDLFNYARKLVRAAAERAKPDADRLPEYSDSKLALVEKEVLDAKPVDVGVERVVLEFWLTKVREYLTADAPETKLMLGKDSPEALALRLSGSRLADPAYRKQLWDGGEAAIAASDDPMIQYVRATDPAARAVRKVLDDQVEGPIERAQKRIAAARFAVYGDSIYPDATFTLRISYGRVAGWEEAGRTVPPFTVFSGLYERATGAWPFALTQPWLSAQSTLNPDTVFDISTTNDTTGGNSGSPLINAKGEVIGALFDGNIHSLGGSYAYEAATNRSVSVSTAAITEALGKVYRDPALVAELLER
ncbi:MAG: peptidase [Caulobacter sp.]|nr:peptidase [Caulobacter sp.]